MKNQDSLVLFEEFFIAVECSHKQEAEIIETNINIDLTEFQYSKQEIEKLNKLLRRLNTALSDAFSEVCPAASIFTEIRQK